LVFFTGLIDGSLNAAESPDLFFGD